MQATSRDDLDGPAAGSRCANVDSLVAGARGARRKASHRFGPRRSFSHRNCATSRATRRATAACSMSSRDWRSGISLPAPRDKPARTVTVRQRARCAGVAARLPAVDATSGQLVNLEGRINQCRTQRQNVPAHTYESNELLALTALIARQSKGMPMTVASDGPARPFYEQGHSLWNERQGQLNLVMRRNVMTTTSAASCAVIRSPARFRPAIPSIGWSGRVWARCIVA